MTNTPGSKKVIVDSDALIGLIHSDDLLHETCIHILNYLISQNFSIIIPYTIVLEAATSLSRARRVKRPDLSQRLLTDYTKTTHPEYKSDTIPELVAKLYNPSSSSKNTPFDHYVLALAMENNITYVFSFDKFYAKNGLVLTEELITA